MFETTEDATYQIVGILERSKLMPKQLRAKINGKTSRAKFYWLARQTNPFQGEVKTAAYVRGWMWVYEQLTKNNSKPPPTNVYGLNQKYQINNSHFNFPEYYAWVEVTGLDFSKLQVMSGEGDTFSYGVDSDGRYVGPDPIELRRIPLDIFSTQMAELLG